MDDQELFQIVKKNRRKRFFKSSLLAVGFVFIILGILGFSIANHFNLLPHEQAKIIGLPDNQIRYQATKFNEVGALLYEASGSFSFNFKGKQVYLKAEVYEYGEKTKSEILGPQFAEEEAFEMAGALILGVDSRQKVIDYAMNTNGGGTRGHLKLNDYGLKNDVELAGFTLGFSVHTTAGVRPTMLSNSNYRILANQQMPILVTGSGDKLVFGSEKPAKLYADIPWVLVISLEFVK